MTFARGARWLAAVALMMATNAFADAASDQVSRSNAATRLFMDFCLATTGDFAKVNGLATQNHLPFVRPDFAPHFLGGKAGRVWSATSSLGEFVIIGTEDNTCQVWAKQADAPTSIQHLNRIVSGVPRPGLVVKLVKDETLSGKDGAYRVVAYLMRRDDQVNGMLVSIISSESTTAAVQVRLKIQVAADR